MHAKSGALVSALVSVLLLAGCAAGASQQPSAPPSATPPSPSPVTPSPSPSAAPAAFDLRVVPAEEPTANRMAIPGSDYCFLVVIDSASKSPVTISASATKATVARITPPGLAPGVVGEVCVRADATAEETAGSVTITATRGGVARTAIRTLPVFPMADERAADAKPYFAAWVAWLAKAHPELGIDARTTFQPVFASTLLVVSHYAYWSDEWEMTIAWHNMIAPYDWTEVHLRRRGVDMSPSLAFRRDSVKNATEPHPVAPPESVVR